MSVTSSIIQLCQGTDFTFYRLFCLVSPTDSPTPSRQGNWNLRELAHIHEFFLPFVSAPSSITFFKLAWKKFTSIRLFIIKISGIYSHRLKKKSVVCVTCKINPKTLPLFLSLQTWFEIFFLLILWHNLILFNMGSKLWWMIGLSLHCTFYNLYSIQVVENYVSWAESD